jgi:hypothetical protein
MVTVGMVVLIAGPAAEIMFVRGGTLGLVYDAAWYFWLTAVSKLTIKVTGPTDYAVEALGRIAGPEGD